MNAGRLSFVFSLRQASTSTPLRLLGISLVSELRSTFAPSALQTPPTHNNMTSTHGDLFRFPRPSWCLEAGWPNPGRCRSRTVRSQRYLIAARFIEQATQQR